MRPDRADVYRAVHDAFPTQPIPQSLVVDDSKEARNAATGLAGNMWPAASAGVLERAHYYLTPEAWRYYLPAQLLAALESDLEGYAWSFSVRIAPDMLGVLHGGDKRLEKKLAGLTDAQFAAATDTLFALMDTTTQTGRWCAKALRYGWNVRPSRALEAAKAYYAGLESHSYPPLADPAKAALESKIVASFAEAPYPGDDGICENPEHCDECAGYHVELRGHHWRTMHPDVLKVNDAAPSFLSAAGLRFFLPAWILAELHEDTWNTDPVFHLTYGFDLDEPDRREHALKKLGAFSAREREALVEYLRWRSAHDEFERPKIEKALAEFWTKPS